MSLSAIDEALGIKKSPNDPDVVEIRPPAVIDNDTQVAVAENTDITPLNSSEEKELDYEDDYQFVRDTLRDTIEETLSSFKDLSYLAKQSESPRCYEVLTTAANTIAAVSKNLMDLHEKPKAAEQSGVSVENAVFVGSTKELLEMKKAKKLNG
jgi:hypothetical protein